MYKIILWINYEYALVTMWDHLYIFLIDCINSINIAKIEIDLFCVKQLVVIQSSRNLKFRPSGLVSNIICLPIQRNPRKWSDSVIPCKNAHSIWRPYHLDITWRQSSDCSHQGQAEGSPQEAMVTGECFSNF